MAGIIQLFKGLRKNFLAQVNPTEQAILSMTTGTPISDCDDGGLKSMLSYCCIMVGIRNVPSEDVKMVLLAYLRKYYGDLTTAQVGHAFELTATGRYGDKAPTHFQTMSPAYISDVILLYKKDQFAAKSSYDKVEARAQREINKENKSTPKGYYDRLNRTIKAYNVMPMFWDWEEVFKHLKAIGELQHVAYLPTPEQAKQLVREYFFKKYPLATKQEMQFQKATK